VPLKSKKVQFGVKTTDLERGNEWRGDAYQFKMSSSVERPCGAVFDYHPVGPQLRPLVIAHSTAVVLMLNPAAAYAQSTEVPGTSQHSWPKEGAQ
jgi:hypothetical protein